MIVHAGARALDKLAQEPILTGSIPGRSHANWAGPSFFLYRRSLGLLPDRQRDRVRSEILR